jgi:hypothetical protein
MDADLMLMLVMRLFAIMAATYKLLISSLT